MHAWFEREHPDGRIEKVDLSARHYPLWFAGRELPEGAVLPYVWGFELDLPDFQLVHDPATEPDLEEFTREPWRQEFIIAATEVALRELGLS